MLIYIQAEQTGHWLSSPNKINQTHHGFNINNILFGCGSEKKEHFVWSKRLHSKHRVRSILTTTKSTHPLPTHVWLVIIANTARLTTNSTIQDKVKKGKEWNQKAS